MKRIAAVLLCAVLLVTALPRSVSAQELTKEETIIKEARRSYQYSRSTAGRDSFTGYCGLMSSHQLYNMDINTWCIVNDGNDQFDYYANLEKTTGGYYIKPYSAADYSLEQALNAITCNGTRDAYNILVGFQWTKTEAGNIYGHACVINAILDGTVYFVESFYSSLGGPEGTVLQCSIKEFADYFNSWMIFDGVIYFGTGHYSDCCDRVGTDLFLRARFDSVLRSEPCLVGQNDCVALRDVGAGELLRATGIYTNRDGQQFYQITDGDTLGYVAAGAVSVQRVNAEDLGIGNVQIPRGASEGEDVEVSGTVTAKNAKVGAVEVAVTDSMGNIILRERADVEDYSGDISVLNEMLPFDLLEAGTYRVEVFGDVACPVLAGNEVQTLYERIRLWEQELQVGDESRDAKARSVARRLVKQDRVGWTYRDSTWYCYSYGTPCTGWVSYCGTRYYLDDSGAVTTGLATVDGVQYRFSATGAMLTGWNTTDTGREYRLEDGSLTTGWQTIGTDKYLFTEEGRLVTGGVASDGDLEYTLGQDGKAVPVTEKQIKE